MYCQAIQKETKNNSALLILFLCVSCIILFLSSPQRTSQRVYDGLVFSAVGIIPSVFPVMLTADILLRSGALSFITERLSWVFLKLKRNPEVILPCMVGMICGFPVGARYVCELTKKGKLTKQEADCILAASNCAGPAFVISTIGAGMFSSAKTGVSLWLVSTGTSAVLSLILLPSYTPPPMPALKAGRSYRPKPAFSEILCLSAKSTSLAVLNIACLITYFYTLSDVLSDLIVKAGQSELLSAASAVILELGGGCRRAGELSMPYSLCLSAFGVGFGGMCVYCQVKSEAHEGADMRKYLLIKAVCGAISALFAFFYCKAGCGML